MRITKKIDKLDENVRSRLRSMGIGLNIDSRGYQLDLMKTVLLGEISANLDALCKEMHSISKELSSMNGVDTADDFTNKE